MDPVTVLQIVGGILLALIGLIWFGPKPAGRNSGKFYPHPSEGGEMWRERK